MRVARRRAAAFVLARAAASCVRSRTMARSGRIGGGRRLPHAHRHGRQRRARASCARVRFAAVGSAREERHGRLRRPSRALSAGPCTRKRIAGDIENAASSPHPNRRGGRRCAARRGVPRICSARRSRRVRRRCSRPISPACGACRRRAAAPRRCRQGTGARFGAGIFRRHARRARRCARWAQISRTRCASRVGAACCGALCRMRKSSCRRRRMPDKRVVLGAASGADRSVAVRCRAGTNIADAAGRRRSQGGARPDRARRCGRRGRQASGITR